ncbi:uncharacterized protein LOC115640384 [Gopherus evgoodei]|uniref:uncharacterized protein LOC115640384 n=1 Tax=Gopherus evgoodei TaxID=1825980 RepID=UPI0011CFB45C|nr:uncharacterized protein LOC115640384 [Gopherus evgoodei]
MKLTHVSRWLESAAGIPPIRFCNLHFLGQGCLQLLRDCSPQPAGSSAVRRAGAEPQGRRAFRTWPRLHRPLPTGHRLHRPLPTRPGTGSIALSRLDTGCIAPSGHWLHRPLLTGHQLHRPLPTRPGTGSIALSRLDTGCIAPSRPDRALAPSPSPDWALAVSPPSNPTRHWLHCPLLIGPGTSCIAPSKLGTSSITSSLLDIGSSTTSKSSGECQGYPWGIPKAGTILPPKGGTGRAPCPDHCWAAGWVWAANGDLLSGQFAALP